MSGVTLIELMVVLVILGIISVGVGKFLITTTSASSNLNNKLDISEIRTTILRSVDCEKTLAAAAGSAVGSSIKLYNRKNQVVFNSNGPNGSPVKDHYKLTGDWYGIFTFQGDSIQIKVAKLNSKTNNYAIDPLLNQSLDYNYPGHIIFGASGAIPFCSTGGATSNLEVTYKTTTSDQVLPLVGLDPLSRLDDHYFSRPAVLQLACHRYCLNAGNPTGVLGDFSDMYEEWDNGTFKGAKPYPKGKSTITCNCLE